jgi:hypothetical protein
MERPSLMRQNGGGKHIPNESHLAKSRVITVAPACQTRVKPERVEGLAPS